MPKTTAATTPTPRRGARGGAVALALVAVYLLWGGTFLGNKVALESVPPLTLTTSRFLTAGALILAGARLLGRSLWPGLKEVRSAALVGIFLVGGGSSLLSLGQQYVDTGLASLLIASMPLWALAIGIVVGSRPSRTALSGIIAGLVGLLLLVGASAVSSTVTVGVAILLVSTLTWAIGSTIAQRVRMPADALVSSGWQMLVGGAAAAIVAGAAGEAGDIATISVTGRSALAWLALTVLSTAIGYSCYAWLLQNSSLRLATTYAYVNPVVAVLLGAIVLGERLAWSQVPGSLLILGAVALVLVAERAPVEPAEAALRSSLTLDGPSANYELDVSTRPHAADITQPAVSPCRGTTT